MEGSMDNKRAVFEDVILENGSTIIFDVCGVLEVTTCEDRLEFLDFFLLLEFVIDEERIEGKESSDFMPTVEVLFNLSPVGLENSAILLDLLDRGQN
jgi:hypothetical protein